MLKELLLGLGLCLLITLGDGYSVGAPDQACNTMLPNHNIQPQSSQPPFTLTPSVASVEPGKRISLTLATGDDKPFKGFLVQGRSTVDNQVIGTFFSNDDHKRLICGKGFDVSTKYFLLFHEK